MKSVTELNPLRNEVLPQCFAKFTANRGSEVWFVDFVTDCFVSLGEKTPEEIEKFKTSILLSLESQDLVSFLNQLDFLNQEQLLQMVEGEKLVLRNSAPKIQSAMPAAEDNLYRELVFIHTLPKAFKDLTDEQKATLQKLNSVLCGEQAKPLNIKDYSSIAALTKQKLFENIQQDLFRDESDVGKINMLFASKLYEKLSGAGVDDAMIRKISGELIDFQSAFNKQIKAEPKIKGMMVRGGIASSEEGLRVDKNPHKSANDTYVVIDESVGKKYYAKTFDEAVSKNGKLNSNELFLYKVMEYMGYGPKTNFLVESGSSSAGKSSIFRGNFILTEDVSRPNQEFFLDVEENRDALVQFARHDQRKFAVEMSAAAALTDVLSVADVFGQNAKNYGIVGDPGNPGEYRLQFVDHQPNPGNGLFSTLEEGERLAYSPRESLPKKFGERSLTPLTELAFQSRSGEFVKRAIQDEVHGKLFVQQEGEHDTLENSIRRAKDDVARLVASAPVNFADDAMPILESYIAKIQDNIVTYKRSVGKATPEERGRE